MPSRIARLVALLLAAAALRPSAAGASPRSRATVSGRLLPLRASHVERSFLSREGPRSSPTARPPAECPARDTAGGAAKQQLEVGRSLGAFVASHAPVAGLRNQTVQSEAALSRNLVDREVFGAMKSAGIQPAPPTGDAEFLRRVTLDLTGRIPDGGATVRFLSDTSPEKRSRVIDELLESDAFNDRWTQFLDELFRVTSYASTTELGFPGRDAWHRYLLESMRTHVPYDRIARETMTGTGSTFVSGPANFVIRELAFDGPPQDSFDNMAAAAGRAFLGMNLFCISCHGGAGHTDQINLYLSTKKRREFWGMAAFFAQTDLNFEYIEKTMEYRFDVFENPWGAYLLDTTDGNKTPRRPGPDGAEAVLPSFILNGEGPRSGESPRAALARIVTADRQFARATVNYVWKELFTLGIVEPADGFDLLRLDPKSPPPAPWKIQPTHPALLESLAASFEESGYDLRALIRTIVSSEAYQLSSTYPGEWKSAYVPYFARHYPRRLRSEELADAVSVATAAPIPLYVHGWPAPVLWAGQLPDTLEPLGEDPTGLSYLLWGFLDAFGRGDRDTRPRTSSGSALQALHLMNSYAITLRVSPDLPTRVAALSRIGASSEDIARALYFETLSRPPSPEEMKTALAILTDQKRSRGEAISDLQFALLNKVDFVFNY